MTILVFLSIRRSISSDKNNSLWSSHVFHLRSQGWRSDPVLGVGGSNTQCECTNSCTWTAEGLNHLPHLVSLLLVTCDRRYRVSFPSVLTLCVGGPHTGRGELNGPPDSFSTELCVWFATQGSRGTEWPTENRTRAELKGLPSPQARKRGERSTAQRARRTLMSVEI